MASRHNTRELAADFTSSGLSRKSYCLQKGLSPSTLSYHLRKHRRSREPGPEYSAGSSFVPIDLGADTKGPMSTLIIVKGSFSPEELAKIAGAL